MGNGICCLTNHMVDHTDGNKYYVGADGAMVVSITFKSEEDGKTYTADEDGVCSEVENVSSSTEQILQNIIKDTTLGLTAELKTTIVEIGRVMLNESYKEAFVAGMLANIIHEGRAGYFESSAYTSNPSKKPIYLKYMDDRYNYRSIYSGTNITSHSLPVVYDLLLKLESHNWNQGKFGLGCVQWTGDRTKTLVEKYIRAAGKNDSITFEQVLEAEGNMISSELQSSIYGKIYINWKSDYAGNLDSPKAAYGAGYSLCMDYEKPSDKGTKAPIRAETAKKLYTVMMRT